MAKPFSVLGTLRSAPGVTILMGSRVVLIGCGFVTYALLARTLTTAEFGIYGVISAILNVLNTVLGTGTNQALSRLVSRHREAAASLLVRGLWWACFLTVVAAVSLVAGAPFVARLLRDGSLSRLLMIVALVPGLYAISAAYVGFLNGMRAIGRQGLVNTFLSVARLLTIGGAALLGYGLQGTLWAIVGSAALGALAAYWLARIPAEDSRIDLSAPAFVRMMLSFVGVSLLLQLLLANDLLLVKRLIPLASANQQAGIYTAVQSIARIPYYFLIGISQIVYPRLSARVAAGDIPAARDISTLVLNGMLVALAGGLALCIPLARDVIRIVYPQWYEEGAATLGWLLAGSAALSLAEAALTMLSGAAGPRRSVFVLAAAVAVQLLVGLLLIPRLGAIGAAQATLAAALVAVLAAATLLRRRVGTRLWTRLLGTAGVPVLALVLLGSLWARLRMPPIWTLSFMVVTYLGYLFVLYRLNSVSLKVLLESGGRRSLLVDV